MSSTNPFSDQEWAKIRQLLRDDPDRFGLPKREYGSVLLGSFNIRKLGDPDKRDEQTWRFLADVCRHFDLLAVQEIIGHPCSKTYRMMAINAHLIFGDYMSDRRLEFDALMDWIINRVQQDSAYYKNFVLLGDLNLNFDDPARDRRAIERHLKTFDTKAGDKVKVVFPFLDKHPTQGDVFRTNARLTETFDQIGLFYKPTDLPPHLQKAAMGMDTRLGPDYGMFNFVQLFSEALLGRPYVCKPEDEAVAEEQKELLARFEHRVSDHMPIWVRIPLFEAPLMGKPTEA